MAPQHRTLNESCPAPNKRRRVDPSKESTTDDSRQNKKQKPESTLKSSTPSTSEPTKNPTPKTSSPTSKSNPNTNPQTTPSNSHLTLTHRRASLFDSPPSTLLCHATNAQGTWGAGIAAAFRRTYPSAFKIYAEHCKSHKTSDLLGTILLIPPQTSSWTKSEREARHWIGCLFTSERKGKGKGKGSKESILQATGEVVRDLLEEVREVNGEDWAEKKGASSSGKKRIEEVRMCKINSGLFGVPWEETCEVIEGIEVGVGDVREIAVLSLD